MGVFHVRCRAARASALVVESGGREGRHRETAARKGKERRDKLSGRGKRETEKYREEYGEGSTSGKGAVRREGGRKIEKAGRDGVGGAGELEEWRL